MGRGGERAPSGGAGREAHSKEEPERDLDHYHPHHFQAKKARTLKLSRRAHLFLTFEEPEYSYTARFVSFILNVCIFLSVIAFILGSMAQFKHTPHECEEFLSVGQVCYGPNGDITDVISHHAHHAAGGTEDGGADGKGAAHAHRGLWLPSSLAPRGLAEAHTPAAAAAAAAGGGMEVEEGLAEGEEPIPKEEAGEHWAPGCHHVCEPEANLGVEVLEYIAMAFFTIDYLIRLLCVHAVPYRLLDSNGYQRKRATGRYREPSGLSKTVHHFFHAMNIIDLLALAPFYFRTLVEKVFPEAMESGIFRVFRLFRIFRIAPFYMHMVASTHGVLESGEKPHFMHFDLTWFFDMLKIGAYAEGAPVIFWAIKASVPAIAAFTIGTLILTIAMGTLMYLAEHGRFRVTAEYPQGAFLAPSTYTGEEALAESPHGSILMSMWYIVSDTTTMSTIQMLVPHSAPGMVIDVMMYVVCLKIDLIAIMILTMPITIIIRNFHEQYEFFFKSRGASEAGAEPGSAEDQGEDKGEEEEEEEEEEEARIFGYADERRAASPSKKPPPTDGDVELAMADDSKAADG